MQESMGTLGSSCRTNKGRRVERRNCSLGCLERLPFRLVGNHCACAATGRSQNVFPFAKLHKAASDLTVALELLFIDAQYEWEEIYAGKMGDDDIMAARRKMQKLRLEAEQKFFSARIKICRTSN